MTPAPEHTANLLGALAVALADRIGDAVSSAAGQSASAATALSALQHFVGVNPAVPPTVDTLRRVLGLTSSGAVRLVDRLASAGLVTRSPGRDARETHIRLTPTGRRAARRVTSARLDVLTEALDPLDDRDRALLDELAGRILAGMIREPGATRWTCRLCDLTACGRATDDCPVANEAARRYG